MCSSLLSRPLPTPTPCPLIAASNAAPTLCSSPGCASSAPRCSAQSGHAHRSPHVHPEPASRVSALNGGIKVRAAPPPAGACEDGYRWGGENGKAGIEGDAAGGKSSGGRAGPRSGDWARLARFGCARGWAQGRARGDCVGEAVGVGARGCFSAGDAAPCVLCGGVGVGVGVGGDAESLTQHSAAARASVARPLFRAPRSKAAVAAAEVLARH